MARWGRCDYRQIQRLQQRMEQLQQVDFDAFCEKMAKELAKKLLRKVTNRTPVSLPPGGGTLKGSWDIGEIRKEGHTYVIEVINSSEYSSYVEYGHRQKPGRFVPGYWQGQRFIYDPNADGGMVLKQGWVKGRFMLTMSEMELQAQAPAIIEKELKKFLKEELGW